MQNSRTDLSSFGKTYQYVDYGKLYTKKFDIQVKTTERLEYNEKKTTNSRFWIA